VELVELGIVKVATQADKAAITDSVSTGRALIIEIEPVHVNFFTLLKDA